MKLLGILGAIIALVGAIFVFQNSTGSFSPIVHTVLSTLYQNPPESVIIETSETTKLDITNSYVDYLRFSLGMTLFSLGSLVAMGSNLRRTQQSTESRILQGVIGFGLVAAGSGLFAATAKILNLFDTMSHSGAAVTKQLTWGFGEQLPLLSIVGSILVCCSLGFIALSIIAIFTKIKKSEIAFSVSSKVWLVIAAICFVGVTISMQIMNVSVETLRKWMAVAANGDASVDPASLAGLISQYLKMALLCGASLLVAGICTSALSVCGRKAV